MSRVLTVVWLYCCLFAVLSLLGVGLVSGDALTSAETYYSFDNDNLSGSDPRDLSGNGNDGTNNGAKIGVKGILEQAFNFTASESDTVDTNVGVDDPSSYSISVWFNTTTAITGKNFVYAFGGGRVRGGYDMISGSNFVYQHCHYDGGWKCVNDSVTSNDGVWYHFVAVYTGSRLRLYKNGVLIQNGSGVGDPQYNGNDYLARSGTNNAFWDGEIDEFGFYRGVVLNNSDVSELYNSGAGFNPYKNGVDGIVFVEEQHSGAAFTNSRTVGAFSDVEAGDVLVAVAAINTAAGGVDSPPVGWTRIVRETYGGPVFEVWTNTSNGSLGSTVWGFNSTHWVNVGILAYRNASEPDGSIWGVATTDTSSSTSVDAPSVNSVFDDSLLLMIGVSSDNSDNETWSNGTLRMNTDDDHAEIIVNDVDLLLAGATGENTYSADYTGFSYIAGGHLVLGPFVSPPVPSPNVTVTLGDSLQGMVAPMLLESAQFPRPASCALEDGGGAMDIPYFEDIVSSSGLTGIRINANWDDKYPTYPNTSSPWYQTNTSCLRVVTQYYLNLSQPVVLELHSLPSSLAVSNASFCSAGSSSCYPANYVTYGAAAADFVDLLVPYTDRDENLTVSVCNEPELPQFFGNNLARSTANAPVRGVYCGRMAVAVRDALDSAGRFDVTVLGPDVTMRHYTESDMTGNENDTTILLTNFAETIGTCSGYGLTMHAYSDAWQIGGSDEPVTYAQYFDEAWEQHFNATVVANMSCLFQDKVWITEGFLQDAALNNGSEGFETYLVQSLAAYYSILNKNVSDIRLAQYGGYQLVANGCVNPSYPEYPKCWDPWSPPYIGDYNRSPIVAMFEMEQFLTGNVTQKRNLSFPLSSGVSSLATVSSTEGHRLSLVNINTSSVVVYLDVSQTSVNNVTDLQNGSVFSRISGVITIPIANESSNFYFMGLNSSAPSASTPLYSPLNVLPNVDVTWNTTVSDADGELVSVTIEHRVNGSTVAWDNRTNLVSGTVVNSTLSSSFYGSSDNVSVFVTPFNALTGSTVNNSFIVNGTAPSASTPLYSPSVIYPGVDADWNFTLSDPDGELINATVAFYVNGVLAYYANQTNRASGTVVNLTITSGNYSAGDNVSLNVTPYNYESGVMVSNSFIVNTPAHVEALSHTPSPLYQNVSVVVNGSLWDADSESAQILWNYSVNGVLVDNGSFGTYPTNGWTLNLTITSGNYSAGDTVLVWFYFANGTVGIGNSTSFVVVDNTPAFTLMANNSYNGTPLQSFSVTVTRSGAAQYFFEPVGDSYSLSYNAGVQANMFWNYTVPAWGDPALSYWQIKYGDGPTFVNVSPSAACSLQRPLRYWTYSSELVGIPEYRTQWSCDNGVGYTTLAGSVSVSTAGAYTLSNCGSATYWRDGDFGTASAYNQTKDLLCDVTSGVYESDSAVYDQGMWWYNATSKTYSTTNGTIVTDIQNSAVYLVNVTFTSSENGGYYSRTYVNVNVSDNLTALMHQAQVNFTAENRVSGVSVSGFTVSTSSLGGSESVSDAPHGMNLSAGSFLFSWAKGGNFYTGSLSSVIVALTNSTKNFSVFDHKLRVNLSAGSGSPNLTAFTASVYSYNYTFYEQLSTTNGSIIFNLTPGDYRVSINTSGLEFVQVNITLNNSVNLTNLTLQVSEGSTFNISFWNESTNLQLVNRTIYYELISAAYAVNGSTTNASTIQAALPAGNYTINYWRQSDVRRSYFVYLSNKSAENLRLYLLDSELMSLYVPVVTDADGQACPNMTVSLLRYYTDINGYRVVEMAKTDTNGQGLLHVRANEINYKLLFVGGCGSFTSDPQKIVSSSDGFTVVGAQGLLTSSSAVQSALVNITYVNATQTYVFTWADSENVVTQGCLVVRRGANGTSRLMSDSCSNSSSGSLIYTLTGNLTDTEWSSQGILKTSDTRGFPFRGPDVNFLESLTTWGVAGVFWGLILLLGVVMLVANSAGALVFSSIGSLVVLITLGLVAGGGAVVAGLVIIGLVMLYKIRTS